jgi:hypothetical protein
MLMQQCWSHSTRGCCNRLHRPIPQLPMDRSYSCGACCCCYSCGLLLLPPRV